MLSRLVITFCPRINKTRTVKKIIIKYNILTQWTKETKNDIQLLTKAKIGGGGSYIKVPTEGKSSENKAN